MAAGSADDPIYKQFQKSILARGFAARNPVIIEKKLVTLEQEVRQKLIQIGHPTYKKIFEFAGKPKTIDATIFHKMCTNLDLRINLKDAKLLLVSMTQGRSKLPVKQFIQAITQDKTMNWTQMKNQATQKHQLSKTYSDGNTTYLRPEFRNEQNQERQHRAASHFGASNVAKIGIEGLVEQQLKERTRHAHERTLLIRKIFDPLLDASFGASRLVRASKFAKGIRRLGVLVTDRELKQAIHKYSVVIVKHNKKTKLINLDAFLNKGIALPNPNLSPAAKIADPLKRLNKQSGLSLPNRGIPDDFGIRRIATPKLKNLILKKINERSRPGGGMCLEAFKMFAPGKAKGAITPRYFNQRLKDYGLVLNQHRSDALLNAVDIDGGGDVSFNEFAEHFLPKGIQSGSLTDKLAAGSLKKQMNKRRRSKDQSMNMTLKPMDRKYISKTYPSTYPSKELNVDQDNIQEIQIERHSTPKSVARPEEDPGWVTMPSPLRSGRSHIQAVAMSTYRSNKQHSAQSSSMNSMNSSQSMKSFLIKPSPIRRREKRFLVPSEQDEASKPWWAQNRQPSRLNWRRLGVEVAAGTITGSYSQCSLRKGAEKFVL